jgi:hypothetical protein
MKNTAFELVNQYVTGWKQNDIKQICSCLLENCVVVESHGTTYCGIQDIEDWFRAWLAAKSKIIKWDILYFYYCDQEETAVFEWNFACISNDTEYLLSGISVIKFADEKIASIKEYRLTKPAHTWEKDKLESE